MSQRLLITIVAIGVVLAVGLSALVSWGVTSSMIASATIAGPAGADGRDGAPGPQGIPGADGKDGADGAPGSAAVGKPGAAGADGRDATSTPPVTYSRAAGAANLTWDENTPVGTISLPAGTYTISYTMSGVSAALISGATGNGFEPANCGLSDGGTPIHTDEAYVGGGSVDFARTQIVTTTQTTTFAITCTTIGGPGWGIVVEVSWSELTLTAARLD